MVVVRGREVCDMCHVSGHYRKSVYNMSHLPVFILVESDSRGILTGHKYQVVVVMVKVMHPNSPNKVTSLTLHRIEAMRRIGNIGRVKAMKKKNGGCKGRDRKDDVMDTTSGQ